MEFEPALENRAVTGQRCAKMTSHPFVDAIVSGLEGVVSSERIEIAGTWNSSSRQVYKDLARLGTGQGPFVEAVDYRWRGSVSCSKALEAIGLLITPSEVWWIKSPPRQEVLTVEVAVSSWRRDTRGGATFTPSIARSVLPGVPVPFEGDVEGFPLGPSVSTTGVAMVVASPKDATFVIVALPRDVTKVGRNQIWHLRSDLAERVPETARNILTRGRTGRLKSP